MRIDKVPSIPVPTGPVQARFLSTLRWLLYFGLWTQSRSPAFAWQAIDCRASWQDGTQTQSNRDPKVGISSIRRVATRRPVTIAVPTPVDELLVGLARRLLHNHDGPSEKASVWDQSTGPKRSGCHEVHAGESGHVNDYVMPPFLPNIEEARKMQTLHEKVQWKNVRPPAVAGTFYPANPTSLQRMVDAFLEEASCIGPRPKAMIAPHAGYVFSGPVAATAYALLQQRKGEVTRVVVMGPSHHVPFYGMAAPRSDAFATPLGIVPVDQEAIHAILHWPQVELRDDAHRLEHSIEVHLPFLQRTLGPLPIVPLVIGNASATDVAEVLESLWKDDRTVVIASSDLSHYHDYWTARAIDSETTRLIEEKQWQYLSGERACGFMGIRGLLKVATDRDLQVKAVDLRNSGDTGGDKHRVVGYGSYVLY
ncbi:MAG: hypothetical protein KatS3mg111_0329 [Pirellulaceae bacterium]|nr:MAG: hypothetical protein KatS3mg111_0329 [Pirellulaceae bacterium]